MFSRSCSCRIGAAQHFVVSVIVLHGSQCVIRGQRLASQASLAPRLSVLMLSVIHADRILDIPEKDDPVKDSGIPEFSEISH